MKRPLLKPICRIVVMRMAIPIALYVHKVSSRFMNCKLGINRHRFSKALTDDSFITHLNIIYENRNTRRIYRKQG